MKHPEPRNEHERDFLQAFGKLHYDHERHEIWAAFIHMTALAIAAGADRRHAAEREKLYQDIRRGYTDQQGTLFARLFAVTMEALEENPFQDFLGEMYMRCELGNDHIGQFFTPFSICKMMARAALSSQEATIREALDESGYISLVDPCVGGGAMMIAGAAALIEMGINYQQCAIFAGQDLDDTTAMTAYIQLSLIGCPGYVIVGDSLREPMSGNALLAEEEERCFCTPMYFSESMRELRKRACIKGFLTMPGKRRGGIITLTGGADSGGNEAGTGQPG